MPSPSRERDLPPEHGELRPARQGKQPRGALDQVKQRGLAREADRGKQTPPIARVMPDSSPAPILTLTLSERVLPPGSALWGERGSKPCSFSAAEARA
jgi:hypothetical protein